MRKITKQKYQKAVVHKKKMSTNFLSQARIVNRDGDQIVDNLLTGNCGCGTCGCGYTICAY